MKKNHFNQNQLSSIKLKSNGKCFYCGGNLDEDFEIEDFVDELYVEYDYVSICKRCKDIKNGMTVEQFRNYIADIIDDLENNTIYSLLFDIGQIKKTEDIIKFYGEKEGEQTNLYEIIIGNVKKQISHYFNIKEEDIDEETRKQDIVWPRQVAHYFSYKKTKLSSEYIGSRIGKKDHSTVLHSIKTVEKEIDTNKEKKKQIEYLSKIFDLQE